VVRELQKLSLMGAALSIDDVVMIGDEDVELLDTDDDDEFDIGPASRIRAVVVIDPAAIPRRAPPRASSPPSDPLSARAELVLYYVDGQTPVLALVALCPLTEAQTLSALRELLRSAKITIF
jgi:hypothetical protein